MQELINSGISVRKIAKALKMSRNTVAKYQTGDLDYLVEDTRGRAFTQLLTYEAEMIDLLKAGHIRKEVFTYIEQQGFMGKRSQFYKFCTNLEKSGQIPPVKNHLPANALLMPSGKKQYHYVTRRQVMNYIWRGIEIKMSDWVMITKAYPIIKTLQNCIDHFRKMFEKKDITELASFIKLYQESECKALKTFSKSLFKDIIPVSYAVSEDYNNGFVEGINNKLKMIKRVSYGRCKFPLLKAKMILASFFDF